MKGFIQLCIHFNLLNSISKGIGGDLKFSVCVNICGEFYIEL